MQAQGVASVALQKPAFRGGRGRAVGSLMGERLSSLGIAAKIKEHTAPLVWAEMVGPQIAHATQVEKVADGILFVACRSAMWSHELTFHKADILRRLNEKIGASPRDPLIRDIRFNNKGLRRPDTPIEKAPPLQPTRDELEDIAVTESEMATIEEAIAVVHDAGMRERLRRARIADARLRTWRHENGWSPCLRCGEIAPPTFPIDGTVNCARCRTTAHRGR